MNDITSSLVFRIIVPSLGMQTAHWNTFRLSGFIMFACPNLTSMPVIAPGASPYVFDMILRDRSQRNSNLRHLDLKMESIAALELRMTIATRRCFKLHQQLSLCLKNVAITCSTILITIISTRSWWEAQIDSPVLIVLANEKVTLFLRLFQDARMFFRFTCIILFN